MVLHIGFTGTSHSPGMTPKQIADLRNCLLQCFRRGAVFHHGDCIMADEQAHFIALECGYAVEIHPPEDPKARAFCKGARIVHPVKPYIARNHDIVDVASQMFAAPRGNEASEPRSGTWASVRYARSHNKPVQIIWPWAT